jgi:hypothetical protein
LAEAAIIVGVKLRCMDIGAHGVVIAQKLVEDSPGMT